MYRRRHESRRSSKAQTALRKKKQKKIKYGEKRFSIWRMEFLHPAMWHDHDIDFARWLHLAIWHVALGSSQWIHQVAAPCNVAGVSSMTYHLIRPNVRHIGILHWFRFRPHQRSRRVILHQSPKFCATQPTEWGIKRMREREWGRMRMGIMYSHFDTIHKRDRHLDGRADRHVAMT